MSKSEVKNPKTRINAILKDGQVEKLLIKSKFNDWNGMEKIFLKKSLTRDVENNIIDKSTGEVIQSFSQRNYVFTDKEPEYIKIYLADLSKLKNLPKGHEQLLFELFGLCGWGGIIGLTAPIKKMIAERINLANRTIDKYISNLVDAEILFRAGLGTYVFNPNLISKGKWAEVRKLRLCIEYDVNENGVLTDKTVSTELIESHQEVAAAIDERVSKEEIIQASTTKKRGRPKGSKNKEKITV